MSYICVYCAMCGLGSTKYLYVVLFEMWNISKKLDLWLSQQHTFCFLYSAGNGVRNSLTDCVIDCSYWLQIFATQTPGYCWLQLLILFSDYIGTVLSSKVCISLCLQVTYALVNWRHRLSKYVHVSVFSISSYWCRHVLTFLNIIWNI